MEVNNGYLLGVAYNNTESLPFPVDPSEELDTVPEFLWNSESGAGPYEPSEMEPDVLEIDSYGFDYTDKLDLSVDPSGLKIIFTNPDYLHGLMFTVRNKGLDDSVEVEWYGVTEENSGDCTNHEYQLNGDDDQINNACTPTDESGKMIVNLKSLKGSVSDVESEVFNWRNGDGCN